MTRRGRTVLLVLVLLAAGLAGCVGGDGPADGDDGGDGNGDGNGDVEPVAEAPQWELGDAWTFEMATHEFPRTESTMMVYDDDGQNYRIGTESRRQALVHSVMNVNPQIGRIQKGNLAVFEDGEPRAMYDFPITDGKTWTTGFFVSQHGGTLTAEASYVESIQTPLGAMEGFSIEATNDDGFRVAYDYVPGVKWFTRLVVTDVDGTQLHELVLQDFQEDRTGTAWFVRGSDLLPDEPEEGQDYRSYEPSECGAPTGCSDTVLVDGASDPKDDGPYDVVGFNLLVEIPNESQDRADITITDGDGNEILSRTFLQSQQSEKNFTLVRDYASGDWSVDVTLYGNAEVDVKMAGAWEYSGTVE